ncbi:MAG: FAD-binding protein [Bacteroidales bacterium]|nr:FAD-binding protein [Bacteroidales bacterium]
MQKEIQLRITPQEAASEDSLKQAVARETSISVGEITAIRVLKRSIDARQRSIFINVKLQVFVNEEPQGDLIQRNEYKDVSNAKQVIVVGAGPAGLFAALRLIELGLKPIVIERGKNVNERKRDIGLISREHIVDPESNYSFGEGGAGAFSDGKLYTRSKKRGSVDRILNIFCQFGANPTILADAHPHIGTDKLPAVIKKMRQQIVNSGGEVHFGTRMDNLIIENNSILGIETNTGNQFLGSVILATGHSARDVYYLLKRKAIHLESKGFAVGVRLEHPQPLIDQIQYHSPQGRGEYLPAAEYSLVAQAKDRGVYSFCMCPGGVVVPAASGPEQVVVNGMSASRRGSKFANAGMVVEVRPEDFPQYAKHGELALLKFQEQFEYDSWVQGGKRQSAPAQRMDDFVNNRSSSSLPDTSYAPGLTDTRFVDWMPKAITDRLRDGFQQFGRNSRGFLTNDAVMIGVESRTSSPVRIPRDRESFQHIVFKGLYPCGEGAGYAGGIVSSAIDGERTAEAVAAMMGV